MTSADMFLVPAEVTAKRRVSPHMLELDFACPRLGEIGLTGRPDEFVHLVFDDAEPGNANTRHYTLRSADAARGVFTVDFVVHDVGLASDWAVAAQPGALVRVSEAHGYYSVPADAAWVTLAADATALPALLRILEEAPARVPIRVIAEVAEPGDKIELASAATLDVTWLIGGNGRMPTRLPDALVAEGRPEGDGYLWVAGEGQMTRDIRKHVRAHWGLRPDQYKIVGYWHSRTLLDKWDSLAPEQIEELAALWDEDATDEENWDRYEPQLQRLGI